MTIATIIFLELSITILVSDTDHFLHTSKMESVRHEVPDYDVVPGTVYLVQGTHQAGFSSQDIILMPTPSSDPRDPLVR